MVFPLAWVRGQKIPNTCHSLRIYPYPMVWPLPRPWSQSPSLSRESPRNIGFSGSAAPINKNANALEQHPGTGGGVNVAPVLWKRRAAIGPEAKSHLSGSRRLFDPQIDPKVTFSANKGLPPPLGRGVCETKSKNGRSRPRKPFISRVFSAQRGSETMVLDHGLARGQTMG